MGSHIANPGRGVSLPLAPARGLEVIVRPEGSIHGLSPFSVFADAKAGGIRNIRNRKQEVDEALGRTLTDKREEDSEGYNLAAVEGGKYSHVVYKSETLKVINLLLLC